MKIGRLNRASFAKIARRAMLLFAFAALGAQAAMVAKVGDVGYETLEAAIEAASPGSTVAVCDDIRQDKTLTIQGKDLTLDLNGKTLTVATEGDGIVVQDATLNLGNSGGTGKYVFECSASGSDGIYLHNTREDGGSILNINSNVDILFKPGVNSAIHAYGEAGKAVVNMNAGNVYAKGKGQKVSAVIIDQNAAFNMKGGTFDLDVDFDTFSQNNNDVVGVLVWGQNGVQKNGTVKIEGGSFNVGGKNAFAQIVQVGMKNGKSDNVSVEISGGEIVLSPSGDGEGYVFTPYNAAYASATMSGGRIRGTVTALTATASGADTANMIVSGGTFPFEVKESYCADGVTVKATTDADGNTVYGVVEETELVNYVTLELVFGGNVADEDVVAAKALYAQEKYETCKAANEAYMALFGVTWGKGYLDVTDNTAPLYKYAGRSGSVSEVRFYIHGTLAGFTSLQSSGNQIDCTVGGNHQIFRTSYSIIGVDGADGKAKLTDGNVQAYVAGGYASMFTASGKLTIDNIEFTSTTSTTVGASATRATESDTENEVASAEMEIKNCTFRGRLYVYDNFENQGKMTYSIHNCVFDGSNYSGDSNAYAIFAQCKGGNNLVIKDNAIAGFARGINIDHANVHATIEGNTISVTDTGRSCIQLSSLATANIVGNTLELTGGNAITLHEKLLTLSPAPEVSISGNTVTGTGYLVYDDAKANEKEFTSDNLKLTYATDNVVAATVNTTKGVKGSTEYALSETVATTLHSVDFAAFVKALTDANYTFDGSTHALAQNGKLTVKWSPVSGCYYDRADHVCTVGNVIATANTPKRVNSGLTQFQLFEGASHAVSVKNVAFVYEPAAFTVCENSGWKGSFTAEKAPAGQIYLMNKGDVTFEDCSFDKVVLTSFNCTGTSTVKNCSFKDVYNSYAVKDIRGATVAVTSCTFENCGAAVMVSSTVKVGAVTIRGNTFTKVDVAGTAPDNKVGTRGLVQIASSGNYAGTAFDFSENKATDCGPVLRQLNETVSFDADDKTNLGKLVSADGASTFYTDDTFVAQVGDTKYATLAEAFAALSAGNHTLALLKNAAWNAATPVYWAAGTQSGYAATLTAALTAAYKANAGAITIVCRPGADVGTMTHGHVADDLTIYGNKAFISGGECDLEVDQYKFSRATGALAEDGVYLDKNITITAYELDNLGVWGQRHTAHTVTVNLTDCDGKGTDFNGQGNPQRVYISGTTGVNNITLTGCDFLTKATAVYSNADGAIKAVNCSFKGGQVPFNINHKANGTQTVAVEKCTFTNCGDNGDWKQFAAPLRLVNSGSGTLSAEVKGCAFAGTVGANGDILLGDGRKDQASNDVELKVVNTAANIQAQKPGYYGGETVDTTKMATAESLATDTLVTSVAQLLPVDPRTLGYATSGKAEALPETPNMNGEVVNVTAAQAQYVLDGAYGPIDGKTINFTESIKDTLILGRASKYDGSKTVYRHGSHTGEALSYAEFIAYKNQSGWTESCYYERTVENVTFTANEGVIVKNFEADGGAHIYAGTAPVYDYVRDTGSWLNEGSCYFKRANLKNITFKGLTFKAKTDINTSESTTVYDGFTFKNCTFDLGSTAVGNQAIRYYNENNNGNVKNLVVEGCTFKTCYQGVYTAHVKNVTVKDCTFDTTGHNAIAIQSQGGDKGPCNHGAVVITGNKMVNIGDRAIRFGVVAAGTTITITGNTATYKDGTAATEKQCIKAESLAEGVTTTVELNNWNNYAVAANKPLTETVAKIGTTDYKSLEDATESAQVDDVITIVGYTSNMTAPDGWKFVTKEGVTTLVADPVLVKGVDGKFHIASYDHLLLFKKMVNEKGMNFSGETVVLDADISCTETWTAAIGTFTGTLDGNGKTISKLKVVSASDHAALFSKIEGATVLGLTISEAEITSASGNYNAVLAAEAVNSTITGVQILSSTVTTAGEYAGAVYGGGYAAVSGCTVDKCAVTGTEQIGGLAGYMWLRSITDCTISETTVTATAQRAGLLVGKMQVAKGNLGASSMSISGNTVDGKVVTPAVAGGLIGQIMGDDPRYEIKDNDIDVVFECAGEKAPIGVLRSSQAVAFTEKISTNITGNWWENATLDANKYTYTNTNGAGDQVVVRGVAQVGTTTYKTLAAALAVANAEGAVCELIADVTLKGTWTPIPNFKGTFDGKNHKITGLNVSGSEYVGLIGVLDGGTVKNVQFASVDVSGGTDAGTAVGRIINGGTVDNVKVLSGTVSGSKRVGGVVGSIKACGTVKNCENAAKVEASTYNVGGIVGAAYYTETGKEMYITDCRNTADITSAGVGAGGIVGLSCANVSGNTNTGAVKGKEVGGIVGEQKTYGSVTGNTNSGAVTNTGTGTDNWGTGGIIGWLRYHGTSENSAYPQSAIITVSGNSNSGTITGGNDAGGIVGVVYNSAVITNNSNTAATLSGTTFAAGIVGNYQITETPAAVEPAKNKLTFTDNTSTTALDNITANNKDLLIYDNREKVAQIGDKKYATLAEAVKAAKIGDTIKVIANDASLSVPEGWTISGSTLIPVDKTWHIANLDQLKEFQSAVNGGNTFDGQTVVLDENIDMASVENWTPVGNASEKKFAGTFDGQNHTISGLKITGGSYVGLFGYLGAATVQNVALVGANVSGVKRVGALVGQIAGDATIKNCSLDTTSSVTGSDSNTGGLIGEASGSIVVTLENLTNNAPVTNTESGMSRAAGILCQATSGASVTLKNCVNNGTITTNGGGYAGGIVSAKQGGASLVFDGCSNTGTLANGTKGTGALLAWSCNGSSVTISNYSGDVANAIGWLSQDNYDHVFVINGVEHYIRVAKGGSGYTFASRYEAARLMNKSYLQEIIGFFNYAKTVNANFEGYPATPVEVLKSAYSTSDGSIKGGLFNTDVSSGWPQLLRQYNATSGKSLTADNFAVTWGTRDVLFMVGDAVAKIGNSYYATLDAAVAAVQDGETITVLNYDADNMTAPDGWKFVTEEGVTTLELDVITISTVEELVAFSAAVNGGERYANKIVRLTQDLDMTGIDFVPIGNVSGYPGKSFYGVFDGQNHTIRNLTVSDTTKDWASAALFGSLCGTVQNVKLENVNITSSHYAAALVGYSSDGNTTAVIKNCHVDGGTVTSTPEEVSAGKYDNGDKVGGLAGYLAQGVALEGCTVKNLTVTAYRDVAGLVGYANTGVTVKNSSVTDTTVVSDHRYNYKNYDSDEWYDANAIIGEASSSAVLTDNTFSNVNFAILENVAQIGDVKYATLAEAVAAATAGQTITLISDVADAGNVSLKAGVTLDGDGHKVTGNSAVSINEAGGTVRNVVFKDIHKADNKLSAVYARYLEGTATITGCTFDNCDWDAIQATPVAGAVLTITGNVFDTDNTDGVQQQRYVHIQSAANVDFTATVTGNVMKGDTKQGALEAYYFADEKKIDVSHNYIEDMADVCILDGTGALRNDTVFPAYKDAEKTELYQPVAMIATSAYSADYYPTVAAALIGAKSGDTIQILAGTWGADAIGKLDEEGEYTNANIVRYKSLTIQPAKGAEVTFTSTLSLGYDDSSTANATMTVKDLTFDGASLKIANYVQTTVEGCTFVNGANSAANGTLTIIDSCCTSHKTADAYPVSQVTVKGCSIDGSAAGSPGIRIRNSGNVTITGNVIKNTAHNGILFESNGSVDNTPVKTVLITDNAITEWNVDNVADGGRAMRLDFGTLAAGSAVTIEDNVFRKAEMGLDKPDFMKITGAVVATVSLEDNDWNDELRSTVSGNSDYYTVDTATPVVLNAVVTTKKEPVAQIGETKYETLQAAFDAAKTGDTVTLLANTTLSDYVLDKSVTIRSAGETRYEIKGLKAIAGSGATLENVFLNLDQTLDIGGTDTTLKNCVMRAKDVGYRDIVDGKTTGFTGGKVYQGNAFTYLVRVSGTRVALTDCRIDGTDKDESYFPNMCLAPVSGRDVTMTRCTFNEGFAACYYSTPSGTWTLEDCTFTKIYCYNIQAGDTAAKIVVKGCSLAGWTSFGSSMAEVSFENCAFAKSSGYATIVAYKNATFSGCTFTEDYKDNLYIEENTAVYLNGCSVVDGNGQPSATVSLPEIVALDGATAFAALDAKKDADGKYTAGKFVASSTEVLRAHCAAGYEPVTNGDGTYGVKKVAHVVAVTLGGEKKELPFADAWLADNIGEDASSWTTEALDAKAENGLAKWQCYLFGLDPTKADAKVVATAGQGTEKSIPLAVTNADASPLVTGGYVTVAYVLMGSDDRTAWTEVKTSNKQDGLAIPLTGTTYRFYRVDVTVTSAKGN